MHSVYSPARGVVHRTSGLTSYETISPVRLESSGGVLSTVDMVAQRRDGPRWLRDTLLGVVILMCRRHATPTQAQVRLH